MTDKKDITVQTAQEITVASTQSQAQMLVDTIQQAVAEGRDVETIERLLAMTEKVMDRQAKEEYYDAFHAARSEMPPITARGRNETTRSNYALLSDIQKIIVPIYSRHGFNMVFSTDASPIEGHRRVIAEVSHRAGHSEKYHTDLPMDMTGMKGSQNKTAVHGAGSADSYGQRYLTKLIWNLEIKGDATDDDGNAAGGVELVTDNEAANLAALFEEVGGDKKKFLQPYGCSDFDKVPRKFFAAAIRRLEKKRATS